MKNKQVLNWFFDALIAMLFLTEYWFDFTGLQLHELLGLLLFFLVIVHLLTHEEWVISVSKRLFKNLWKKACLCYIIDFFLLVFFAAITVSGLVISSLLALNLVNYEVWRYVHVSASYLTLGMVGLKLALHWKWIVNTANRKIFRRANPAVGSPKPSCSLAACGDTKRVSRRQFLESTGIFAGSILFAGIEYSAWLSKNGLNSQPEFSAEKNESGAVQIPSQPQPATDVSASTLVTMTESSSVQSTAQPTTTPTLDSTAELVVPQVQTSVRCTRGCSFPGHCRRYTDSNNNNRCDLSEW